MDDEGRKPTKSLWEKGAPRKPVMQRDWARFFFKLKKLGIGIASL